MSGISSGIYQMLGTFQSSFTMSRKNDLSDEYVAEALKKDARASATQYSTMGIDAMLPKR